MPQSSERSSASGRDYHGYQGYDGYHDRSILCFALVTVARFFHQWSMTAVTDTTVEPARKVREPLAQPVGRATAPVKKWRPTKNSKSKRQQAASTDETAATSATAARPLLEQAATSATSGPQGTGTASVSQSSTQANKAVTTTRKRPKVLDARRPHPAAEYFEHNGELGKNTVFDPLSERFAELPAEVQLYSYRRCYRDQSEVITCLKKAFALCLPAESEVGLVAYNQLKADYAQAIQGDTEVKLKNLLAALELSSDVFFYSQNKGHEDKYAEVKKLIAAIQEEHNFTLGKVRMTAALRQENIFLSVPVVRRLMLETGMTPRKGTGGSKPSKLPESPQ